MAIALSVCMIVVGLVAAIWASDVAVTYTRAIAAALGAPAFLVGVVLVSIGTDLPEIANSVAAHLQGEADVNVGDSVGSTLTQLTLVLGLFPLVAGAMAIPRREVAAVTGLTAAALGLVAVFVANGWLGRAEGLVLVTAWAAATWAVARYAPGREPEAPLEVRVGRIRAQAAIVLATLAVVGVGATIAVRGIVRLAEEAGVPEFVLAFFGASLGTSAPEIVVDVTALLRGAPAIALGDALGSSLVDATLSIGVGPIVRPGAVTADLAVPATLYALGATIVVGLLLAVRGRHDRRSAAALLGLYALAYAVVISAD